MVITKGYATVDDFAVRTGLTSTQKTNKTALIEKEIQRNSRRIDKITGNVFYSKTLTTSKCIYGFGINDDGLRMSEDARRIYFPSKIISITTVSTSDDTLTANDDYFVGYDFIEAAGRFPTDREDAVKITGSCGHATTPDDIEEICLAMSEVTTGLGTYTVTDQEGGKTEITRNNMPDWLNDALYTYTRMDNIG